MMPCAADWGPPGARRWSTTTIGIASRPTCCGSTGNSADHDRRLFRMTTLLLAQDFPPMGGGIARLHGELAKRFPRGELVVSTPADPDASEVDSGLPAIVDRLPIGVRRTKTLPAVLFWSRRAASLARQHRVRFVHCGNVKPAGYPARWVHERLHIPYGIFFHGADLLSEQHKIMATVIEALPAILERAPDVCYAVAGTGPDRERLEKRAHELRLGDRVRFLGGVGDQDLPAFYNLASVYVGASRRAERLGVEGFGISLVEASACGLPVVAGDSGGVPDAVRDGETGLLVPPEEPAAIADAICRLLADPAAATRMGQNGRRAVETYFNWDRVVRDLRAIEAEVSAVTAA